MLRITQFIAGLVLLIALEVMSVYFIMPFPGSQRSASVDIAYFLNETIFYLRFVGLLIILFPSVYFFWLGSRKAKLLAGAGIACYLFVFLLFNFRMRADKMFYEPTTRVFASAATNVILDEDLVIGVARDGAAKAYPIEIIGYHHQVRDTVGNTPVMVTYCTVCRTGRVFSPIVNGRPDVFRLVGMDHFNAMFEDATTESWWRQVNGEAVAGPLTGSTLDEIPSSQMSLSAWKMMYPTTTILQPDAAFAEQYRALGEFDEGTTESELVRRDTLSWQEKSWIVGVQIGMRARAYDWNELLRWRVINDTLSGIPIVVAVQDDERSFHVWRRDSLAFEPGSEGMKDRLTESDWNWIGQAVNGPLRGARLEAVQSYQEFWHSWKTFRPQTTRYGFTE